MATAEQVRALVRSHASNDRELFRSIAFQIAAYEDGRGHKALARDIRRYLEKQDVTRAEEHEIEIPEELADLIIPQNCTERLKQLVANEGSKRLIVRILHEYIEQDKLRSYGLSNRRKILLVGPPGTGKTMSARLIAKELRMQFFNVRLDCMVSRYIGETSAKLHQVFDFIQKNKGVYLFDEFDALAGERSMGNDVGEMRRVLNTLLLCIEQDKSEGLIIAATNKPELLDAALFRRFDDFIVYSKPDIDGIRELLLNHLHAYLSKSCNMEKICAACLGFSCADVVKICRDALKTALFQNVETVDEKHIVDAISEHESYKKFIKSDVSN